MSVIEGKTNYYYWHCDESCPDDYCSNMNETSHCNSKYLTGPTGPTGPQGLEGPKDHKGQQYPPSLLPLTEFT